MKVAVITWFRDMNYGTILQAFAMQRYLENELKCSAAIINYIPVRKETISNELSIWQSRLHLR